jgi:phosphotriesterase-related protein
MVDPMVIGLGRYIPRIQQIADPVPDLNIVAATGYYTYQDVPFFSHYRRPDVRSRIGMADPEPMVPMFVADITEGIAGTGVRAGMLKCAIDQPGLTPGGERVIRAVAQAHLETGCPITVHTHPATYQGLVVRQVMAEEGVDAGRVVLGHSSDSTDLDHLTGLAEAGFSLGMDRFGIHMDTRFEARRYTVVELCRRGFAEHMVLSHDAACLIDWVEAEALPFIPQWHYLHIEQDVLPNVHQHGVTEEQITTMLVDSPRRIFEGG